MDLVTIGYNSDVFPQSWSWPVNFLLHVLYLHQHMCVGSHVLNSLVDFVIRPNFYWKSASINNWITLNSPELCLENMGGEGGQVQSWDQILWIAFKYNYRYFWRSQIQNTVHSWIQYFNYRYFWITSPLASVAWIGCNLFSVLYISYVTSRPLI